MKHIQIQFIALVSALACSIIHAAEVTPAEARAIAKEAYIYAFPLVDNYRVQHAYFVDRDSPEFKAPWNQLKNIPRVFTPADTAVQAANTDTPYSFVGMDLRAEPLVFTLPIIEKVAISPSNLSISTRSTSTTWAAAPPVTMAAASSSPGRAGRAKHPRA
jgi:hypothetical protein